MNIIRKFLKREEAKDQPSPHRIDVRPLAPIATPTGRAADIAAVMASPEYAEIRTYFSLYPNRSFMSDHSRAVLYSLVRMMRPQLVAEIGTLHAGTTDPVLGSYYIVSVPDDALAPQVLDRLRHSPAVNAAYLKPPDAMP